MEVMYANKKKRGVKKDESAESPTKSMRIDIMSVPDGQDVLNKIKGLNRIEEFKTYKGTAEKGGGLNRDKVIKYIVLLYSRDSIFNERIPIPFPERQMKAYDMAGFERHKKTGEMDEDIVERLIYLNDDKVFEMVFAFMRFQHSYQWREIVALEHEIEELYKHRMRPIAEYIEVVEKGVKKQIPVPHKEIMVAQEKKDKLKIGCEIRTDRLDELYRAFWGDDEAALKKSKIVDKVSIETWAEDNAELGV